MSGKVCCWGAVWSKHDCLFKKLRPDALIPVRDTAIDQIIAMLQPSFFSKPVDQA